MLGDLRCLTVPSNRQLSNAGDEPSANDVHMNATPMPKGFSSPRSPLGQAAINPAPPWHYSGDVLGVDFWTDPDATSALLPEGLSPDPLSNGHARVMFHDCQFTAQGDEHLDPARYQFREVRVLIDAVWGQIPVMFCPFSFVDNDAALARGWMQGLPMKMGQIFQTRSFAVPGPASSPIRRDSRFSASAAAHGCRLVDLGLTLTQRAEDADSLLERPVALSRYVPQLVAGQQERPTQHELTMLLADDVQVVDLWLGDALLSMPPVAGEELHALDPVRVAFGFRCGLSYTVSDLRVLQEFGDRP